MKLNTLLTSVFSKLGVDTTSTEAQALLNNTQIANIEVAESVTNGLDGNFFTKESAMSNPEIRKAIKAEVLNGMDSTTKELMSRYELDNDSQSEINSEDKTHKKFSKLVDKIAELTREKSKSTGVDKDKLNEQISKLNEQIVNLRTDYEGKLEDEKKSRRLDKINWELDGIYNEQDYSLASEKEIALVSAKAVMGRILEKKGLKFEATELGIQLLTKDGTEYFENNVKITPSNFIKKNLLENKMIKVTTQEVAGRTNNSTTNNTTVAKKDTQFMRELDARIAEAEKR